MDTTDITVRAAAPAELDAAGALVADTYLADGLLDLGPDDPYLADLRDARTRAAHAEVLVATEPTGEETPRGPHGLLGCVTFVGAGGPFAEVAGPGEAEFRMLAVTRAARGRGVGEALVRACLLRARRAGARRVVISSQSRMHTAHRLYGRLGFVRAPERDWEPLPGLRLHAFALELAHKRGE
ncbi:GNAT family N-acetyltransferase [Streptomyces marincola]|uniref:GNAT family N-acetyltransferase n=1 Tax=Streptomyces marincola TaxID=2878388 RepID=A0A1W7D5K7_9ACTN|nr:GNAT family N-acetyltransferase [Streptomyces marincola]ARQ72199.1 GNAT family N-acetyltransferase [Streptomyces marincola]